MFVRVFWGCKLNEKDFFHKNYKYSQSFILKLHIIVCKNLIKWSPFFRLFTLNQPVICTKHGLKVYSIEAYAEDVFRFKDFTSLLFCLRFIYFSLQSSPRQDSLELTWAHSSPFWVHEQKNVYGSKIGKIVKVVGKNCIMKNKIK